MTHRVQRKAGFASSFTLLVPRFFGAFAAWTGGNRLLAKLPPLVGFPGVRVAFPGNRAGFPHLGFHLLALLIGLLSPQFVPQFAFAGLSGSEVVVVVNGGSVNSRTLANHYTKLREIPSINIIVLNNVPDREQITVQEFRELILVPLLQEIEKRGLAARVQCIAYSADFPTAIDISQDLASIKDLHLVFTKVASINGLTYLYDLALRADSSYIVPEINFYARRPFGTYFTNPGGKETESLWADYLLHESASEFKEAVEVLEKIVEKYPFQFPLRYLQASLAARANQPDQALKFLEQAISGGWTNGKYLASDSTFESLRDNDEFQNLELLLDQDSDKWQPAAAFNARSAWAANGVPFAWDPKKNSPGIKYMLSIVLGVTRGVGNTLDEAIVALQRAKEADFRHPQGGFYFASTSDVRSTTRQPLFKQAVDELKKMGFEAEVIYQALPSKKASVLGAQLGTPTFDWKSCESALVPGAIVENLTSLGGVMKAPNYQTPLTHLIASGAAGSSGTVTEPYSVQFKFPTPNLYVHYAQGLSLVEAFYQNVTGPYQLLIVGDPLCQPFSIAPYRSIDVKPQVIEAGGTVTMQPDLTGPSYTDWLLMKDPPAKRTAQLRPVRVGVQVDGGAMQAMAVPQKINLKLENQTLGYHEIQVTTDADDPLKQRSMQVLPVWIGPRDLVRVAMVGSEPGKPRTKSIRDEKLVLSVTAPEGATELAVFHHFEQLATGMASGSSTELTLETSKLGMGPVRLQARAMLQDGSAAASQPLWVELVP
jgi:tetratricopeptide (TPR) repeat protein